MSRIKRTETEAVAPLIDRAGGRSQRDVERGKAMTRFLILTAAAFVVTSVILGWMMRTYFVPGVTLADVFFTTSIVLKLVALLIVILTGVGAVAGLKRNVERVRKASILSVALGIFGAAYGELNTHFGVLIDNVINFTTLAPMRIESLTILALGLFGALPGLGILQLRGAVRRG